MQKNAIFNIFTYIAIFEYKGVLTLFKAIYNVFKYLLKGIYQGLLLSFKVLYFAYDMIYLLIYNVFCLIYMSIKMLIVNFYKGLKFILKDVFLNALVLLVKGIFKILFYFYKGISFVSKVLVFKGTILFGKTIFKILFYFYKGLKIIFYNFIISLVTYFIKGTKVFFAFIGTKISLVIVNVLKCFIKGIITSSEIFGLFYDGIMFSLEPIKNLPDTLEAYKKEKIKAKQDKEMFEANKVKYGYSEEIKEEEVPLFKKMQEWPKKMKKRILEKYQSFGFVKYFENKKMMDSNELLLNFDSEDSVRSDVKKIFKYKAKNTEGKIVIDNFAAFSKIDVHSFLLSEGYEVYSIEEDKWAKLMMMGAVDTGSKKASNKDLIFWITQLSTYIKAGIPLIEGIKILARQAKKAAHKRVFQSITYELIMGESFSTALDKQGKTFPRLFVNMMKTAEMTGELPETLDDMSNYYNAIEKTRKQVMSALMYPIVIFVFSVGVVIFILMFVVPKFVTLYSDLGSELPAITVFIINASEFIKNNAFIIVGVLIGVFACFRIAFKNIKFFRTIMQWLLMRMPFFGKIIIYKEVSMFSKTFGTLQKNSIFITDSMSVLSKITNNEIFKMLIFDTITNLGKGDEISKAFKNNWAFPDIAYHMLVTGEKTGQTAEMMLKVADYYQEEQKNAITKMKSLIEPLTIAFLAIIVGVILLAVVTPMFSMYNGMM